MTKRCLMMEKTRATWRTLVKSYLVHTAILIAAAICLQAFCRLLWNNAENLGTASVLVIGIISIFLYVIVICSIWISGVEKIDAEMQQLINYISVGADINTIKNMDNSVGRRIPKEELESYGYMELSEREADCYCHGELIRHEESLKEVE